MDNKKDEGKFSIKTSSVNIDNYKDFDGQSMQKLGFGFWFVKNKKYLLNNWIDESAIWINKRIKWCYSIVDRG